MNCQDRDASRGADQGGILVLIVSGISTFFRLCAHVCVNTHLQTPCSMSLHDSTEQAGMTSALSSLNRHLIGLGFWE